MSISITVSQQQLLERLGWYVKIRDKEVSLHRYRKNGTPLKSEDVILYETEIVSDWPEAAIIFSVGSYCQPVSQSYWAKLIRRLRSQFRPTISLLHQKPKQIRYYIRAKGFTTVFRVDLAAAVSIFLDRAEQLSSKSG